MKHAKQSRGRSRTWCAWAYLGTGEIQELGCLTCQLVSTGRFAILIRYGVRRGRGGTRSLGVKFSLRRDPRANCTMRRSPIKSEPSVHVRDLHTGTCTSEAVSTYGKLHRMLAVARKRIAAKLTRHNVTRVHGVLVLDETKAVHELDLSDFTSAMGLEMGLDFCLGGIARKVAQVEAGRGYLGHGSSGCQALSC